MDRTEHAITVPSACLLSPPPSPGHVNMHACTLARTDRIGGEYGGGRDSTGLLYLCLTRCAHQGGDAGPRARVHDHLATARVEVELTPSPTPSSVKKSAPSPVGHWGAAAAGGRRSRRQPTIAVAALTLTLTDRQTDRQTHRRVAACPTS
jgi:hypothetical protein